MGIILVLALIMDGMYKVMKHHFKPKPVVVSVNGDLLIPRARDGHFYAQSRVNGRPVTFLIDTGASLVTVNESFARQHCLIGCTCCRPRCWRWNGADGGYVNGFEIRWRNDFQVLHVGRVVEQVVPDARALVHHITGLD